MAVDAPAPGTPVQRSGRGGPADGQRGVIIQTEDGKIAVQLDRAAERLVVPYSSTIWEPVTQARLAPMQIARVAYDADRSYRFARGEYGAREWQALTEKERIAWMQAGPTGADAGRRRLYDAVIGAIGAK